MTVEMGKTISKSLPIGDYEGGKAIRRQEVPEPAAEKAIISPGKEKNKEISRENLELAVSKMNEFIPSRRNVKFEMHEKLDMYYVTIIDSNTKELIKEIPPRKLLDMYAEMADFMGFLIDKKI